VKLSGSGIKSKSGIMVGLGETNDEMSQTLEDLRAHGCDLLTIGQYCGFEAAPARGRVRAPDQFARWKDEALSLGFESVASGPLVRSSYHADLLAAQ